MELIAILTAAKEMGFDVGHLMSLAVMYMMLRKDLRKFVVGQNEALAKVINKQVDKVVEAIKGHNERLDTLEEDVKIIKKSLSDNANR